MITSNSVSLHFSVFLLWFPLCFIHNIVLYFTTNMLQSHSVKYVLALYGPKWEKHPLDLGELLTGFVCEAELHEPLVSYVEIFFSGCFRQRYSVSIIKCYFMGYTMKLQNICITNLCCCNIHLSFCCHLMMHHKVP